MPMDGKQLKAISVPAAKLKLIGQTYDFSTATALRAPAPLVGADAATKTYVDASVTGSDWQPAVAGESLVGNVSLIGLVGNKTALLIEGLSPTSGDAYVVTVANGVGALVTAAVGDIWQYVSATWVKIVTGSGGFVPNLTYTLLSTTTTLIAPFTPVTDNGKVTFYNGTSLSPTTTLAAANGDDYVIAGTGALGKGSLYEWDVTSWEQAVAPSGGFVPAATRAVLSTGTALIAPYVETTDDGKIVQFTGASNTVPVYYTSLDGWAVFCKGSTTNPPTTYNENKTFNFEGTVPTGLWVQMTSGTLPFGTPVNVGAANADGTSFNAARADHVHDSPVSVIADNATSGPGNGAVTTSDGDLATASTAGLSFEPALDGYVSAYVNGLKIQLGNTGFFATSEAYFGIGNTSSGRALSALVAGDTLRWNGSIAGYQIAAAATIDFVYNAF